MSEPGWATVQRAETRMNVMIGMRDGVRLATDVYRPRGAGPTPVLLCRTPYGKNRDVEAIVPYLRAGYAVALQDVRGRHDSEGEWRPFFAEGTDGFDTIEWLAAQPWCDGAVGTFGASYSGWTQWAAARERPPSLRAMASAVTAGRWMQQEVWHNGVLFLVTLNWHALVSGRTLQNTWTSDWHEVFGHLPLRTMDAAAGRDLPAWREWLDHPCLDEYWKDLVFTADDFRAVDVPALHVSGWFDGNLGASVFFYAGMRDHSPAAAAQALVLGPWDHAGAGGNAGPATYAGDDFGAAAALDLAAERVRWFDRHLRGGSAGEPAAARVFTTGSDAWASAAAWPPPTAVTPLFLTDGAAGAAGAGRLVSQPPSAAATATYRYDPDDPLVLIDNWDVYGPALNPAIPAREPVRAPRRILERDDVVVYTGAPLDADVEVAGWPQARLFASSDGPDTDWFVWLHDVDADGRSVDVARGQLRARFHASLAREELLTPDQVYEFVVELSPLAHVFRRGHRIRLLVSSSNFPRYDRNPNTGAPLGQDTATRVARNTIHQHGCHASAVELPVVVR